MKNKGKGKVKDRKIRRISGKPISAFITYSKKRPADENLLTAKKMKKKRVNLSDILAGNTSAELTDSGTPFKYNPNAINSLKKTKKKAANINNKHILSNGHSTTSKVSKEKKKQAKNQKQALKNSFEASSPKPFEAEEENNLKSPETEQTSTEGFSQKTQGRSKKKKDASPVKADVSFNSTTAGATDTEMEESSWDDSQEMIPKSLSNNPVEEGRALFQWLINPLSVEDFFKNNWETSPLHIRRKKLNYYKLLMSTPMMDRILRDFYILYSKNLDITSYSNGQRETHNPPGRARPSVVWDYYSNGCSIRMLNPQTFIPRLHALNATLQEFFGCFVGANSYLTPPDSQGFAPHYDDIEAFIIQIEGKKRWRLYKPATEAEYLPRYSSKNFDPAEIGEPILDTVVNAGDLLYFPRGTIHQGETIDGTHSLHVTLSVYQKNSWCDFVEKLLPEALNRAVQSDTRFREGLPLDYLGHVGLAHSTGNSEVRQNFINKTKDLLHSLVDHIDVDKAADKMAKGHIYDCLPPVLSPEEQERSVLQDGEQMATAGLVENRVEIEPDTRIRLLRSHCVRLIEEENSMRIYYSTENSKEYHEYEPQFLEVERELVPAIQEIIRCYPNFVRVDDLPIEGEDMRVQVARDLWEKCIVVTDVPLPIIE